MNKFRVAIYRRVSTEEQSVEGFSLDAQKEKIMKYLDYDDNFKNKNYIVEDYYDAARSGKDLKRPDLQAMIQAIKGAYNNSKQFPEELIFKYLIVNRLDRLTRSVKDLQELIEILDQADVKLISLNEKIDTSTATGRFFLNVVGSLAQLEREQTSERVIEVFKHLVLEKHVSGRFPYGYFRKETEKGYLPEPYTLKTNRAIQVMSSDSNDIKCSIFPGEIVKQIFTWFLAYKSYTTVSDKLNTLSVPSPAQTYDMITNDNTISEIDLKKWSSQSICNILTNEFYIGKRIYYRHDARLGKTRNKNEWVEIKNAHPKLIKFKIFSQVQQIISERKNKDNRPQYISGGW